MKRADAKLAPNSYEKCQGAFELRLLFLWVTWWLGEQVSSPRGGCGEPWFPFVVSCLGSLW